MNILVTGAYGQLGTELKNRTDEIGNGKPDHFVGEPNHYIFTDYDVLDITNEEAVDEYIKTNHINIVVNCAAYTNVEKAQTDRETAYNVNAKGPMNLALALSKSGGVLIHVSTDYVFGGDRNSPVPPISIGEDVLNYPDMDRDDCFYGYSKNVGEHLIQQVPNSRYIILRTAWLYSPYGKNFVKTMAERARENKPTKVVFDQTGSPTYAGDLADFILHIIEDNTSETQYLLKTGVYNFANKGVASWYDVAWEVFSYLRNNNDINTIISSCLSNEYLSSVKRPAYSVLNVEKTEKTFNYNIKYWRESLDYVLHNIKESDEKVTTYFA